MSELFIGLMSGTSVDAIDAVLMDFSTSSSHIVSSYSQPIDSDLRKIINLLIAKKERPDDIKNVETQFTEASINAVKELLKQSSIVAKDIIAIGSHGQTIFHAPQDTPPVSLQIGSIREIANRTNISTIGNFRQADMDAGGEGAPLACIYHTEVLRVTDEERAVLNLGGIANLTQLPKNKNEPVIGFDTGPANTIMDIWVARHLSQPYDSEGAWAKSGKANDDLLERMLKDYYFSARPPKSTGREHFNIDWLHSHLEKHAKYIPAQDTQATLLALTTQSITNSIKRWCPNTEKLLVCGGGSENTFLIEQLKSTLNNISVEKTSDYGVPAKWLEAMAFAWLAKLHLENKPGNIPSVTGARKEVVLGELASNC